METYALKLLDSECIIFIYIQWQQRSDLCEISQHLYTLERVVLLHVDNTENKRTPA